MATTHHGHPHLIQRGKFLANLKVARGYFTSGRLPVEYTKLCEAVTMGTIEDKYMGEIQPVYGNIVEKVGCRITGECTI